MIKRRRPRMQKKPVVGDDCGSKSLQSDLSEL